MSTTLEPITRITIVLTTDDPSTGDRVIDTLTIDLDLSDKLPGDVMDGDARTTRHDLIATTIHTAVASAARRNAL